MTIQPAFQLSAHEIHLEDTPALTAILNTAKAMARPPISQFRVGALVISNSGQGYLGVNLEFPHNPISQTVHAEQFAITLAHQSSETGIQHLVVSEMPCGHCRQFLMELGNAELPITVIDEQGRKDLLLRDLLPYPFTLAHAESSLMNSPSVKLCLTEDSLKDLSLTALDAASRAYVPYTQSHAGVAILMKDGQVFQGATLESAAYNPTLPALQAALIDLVAHHGDFSNIQAVVLAEREDSQLSLSESSRSLIHSLAPEAKFSTKTARFAEL